MGDTGNSSNKGTISNGAECTTDGHVTFYTSASPDTPQLVMSNKQQISVEEHSRQAAIFEGLIEKLITHFCCE